ncbi:hypothetical protein VNI00_002236 [Paramarasmius palmivorus]|uniref:F-box domain-containing protein n=1 Tax=Paramarasmius palmivorus TaxID=297713 RepID=A0AAW0E4G9_9AGAR
MLPGDTQSRDICVPLSDLRALLTGNSPLPLSSREVLRTSLCDVERRLQEISGIIASQEDGLRRLNEERARLTEFTENARATLHPARFLPKVILAQIFQASVDSESSGIMDMHNFPENTNSLDPSRAPWTFSQVCRQWREVALELPSLWSYIAIDFPNVPTHDPSVSSLLGRLMLQIQRSRTQELTVLLQTLHRIHQHHPLMVAVCSHSARWGTLRLSFAHDDPKPYHTLSSMVKRNLNGLRRLFLQPKFVDDNLSSAGIIDTFVTAPQLRELNVVGYTALLHYHFPITFGQITHFRCELSRHTISLMNSYEYISAMSGLQELLLIGVFPSQDMDKGPNFTLPQLHTLSIAPKSFSVAAARKLLDRLTAPSLHTFRVNGDVSDVECLRSFLSRCASTLKHLCLEDHGMSAPGVIRLLETIPALESLSISSMPEDVVHALAGPSSSSDEIVHLTPKLTELCLLYPKCFMDASLLGLVEARLHHLESSRPPVAKLRKLRFSCEMLTGIKYGTLKALEAFDELDVDFTAEAWLPEDMEGVLQD